MQTWVLPLVLDTDDVIKLPDEALELLTKISTGIILDKVNEFVANNSNSSNPNVAEAAGKLEKAYAGINAMNEYLNSEQAKDMAEVLSSLQYSDISYDTNIHTLRMWRDLIIDLLSEDPEFAASRNVSNGQIEINGYKTAYTPKLDKENLDSVLSKFGDMANDSAFSVTQRSAVSKLYLALNKNSSLFKNGKYNVNKPTVLRKAIYKKDRLLNILKGLDFIIPKMENGENAIGWRQL